MRITFIPIGLLLVRTALGTGANLIHNPALPLDWSNTGKAVEWVFGGHTGAKARRLVGEGDYQAVYPVSLGELAPDGLYRFSFWYKTESLKPSDTAVQIRAGQLAFTYPTSKEWAEARLYFFGKEHQNHLAAQVNGFDGRPRYKTDSTGQELKDARGRRMAANPLKIAVTLDDFELRAVDPRDFAGNLLQNGDFDGGDQAGLPAGWLHWQGDGTITSDGATVVSGKKSLRLIAVPRLFDTLCSGRFPVRAGALYALSFRLKSDSPSSEVRLSINPAGVANTDSLLEGGRLEASLNWERHDFLFEAPDAQDRHYRGAVFPVCLWVRLRSKAQDSSIWMDDVCVTEVFSKRFAGSK